MRRLVQAIALAGVVLALAVLATGPRSKAAPPAKETRKVVVHLSHFTDNLHAGFMALKVAKALQQQRAQVTLFLDLEGARLGHRHNDLQVRWGESNTTLGQLFEDFVKGGGKVIICPHCANHVSVAESTARDGVEIGTEDRIAEMILEANSVIDY